MTPPSTLIDPFVRGIAVGALLVAGLGVWRSGVGRHARLAATMGVFSIACWAITESPVWAALGSPLPILVASLPVGGLFWLFVAAVFEDREVNARTLFPALLTLGTGISMNLATGPLRDVIWTMHNLIGGGLSVYAGFIVLRGWRDDLIESRRRLRGAIFGFSALFGVAEVVLSLGQRFRPLGDWPSFRVGGIYGGAALAVLALASAMMLLQGRPSLFGASRRPEAHDQDARAEAADRALLQRLNAFMDAGGWRTEGLTIGAVAESIEAPEHRLRRLINQKLGHRNFADFVNGHRIEAAKQRLADPGEARTTVAAIAFELGYGSLGPFNRAFRAATGATPTEWRRQALAEASPILEEAV